MSWRTVVVRNSAKIDYQMGFMVIRKEDTIKIHLDEINTVVIESTAVSLTSALLSELMKKKIKVIFCDEKRNPSSELIPYYGSHDTSIKIKRQIQWNNDIKTYVWTSIVTEKIRNQARFLYSLHKEEASILWHYIEELEYGDSTNREGHAAKVYFNALFGMNFTRSDDNSINAALNYGYSLILSLFNREIVANGYITQLGLFHDNMFNPFNLASDLMEPFRPLVDRIVFELKPGKFEHEEKQMVQQIFLKDLKISDRIEHINNAVKIYCRSVFDSLNDNDPSLIKFFRDEL